MVIIFHLTSLFYRGKFDQKATHPTTTTMLNTSWMFFFCCSWNLKYWDICLQFWIKLFFENPVCASKQNHPVKHFWNLYTYTFYWFQLVLQVCLKFREKNSGFWSRFSRTIHSVHQVLFYLFTLYPKTYWSLMISYGTAEISKRTSSSEAWLELLAQTLYVLLCLVP